MTQFELNCQKDRNDRNYEKQIIKSSANFCKMTDGVLGNFLAKMIMENLHEFTDYELKCPFKKVICKNKYRGTTYRYINIIFLLFRSQEKSEKFDSQILTFLNFRDFTV
jgi:hypothetical protein